MEDLPIYLNQLGICVGKLKERILMPQLGGV